MHLHLGSVRVILSDCSSCLLVHLFIPHLLLRAGKYAFNLLNKFYDLPFIFNA